jgi:hypothetical protein
MTGGFPTRTRSGSALLIGLRQSRPRLDMTDQTRVDAPDNWRTRARHVHGHDFRARCGAPIARMRTPSHHSSAFHCDLADVFLYCLVGDARERLDYALKASSTHWTPAGTNCLNAGTRLAV